MKYYKFGIIASIAFFLIFCSCYSRSENWKLVETANPPSTHSFYGLAAADSVNCFLWDAYKEWWGYYFRKTDDGGLIWKTMFWDSCTTGNQIRKILPAIKAIAYPNTKLFLVVGDSGTIIRTSDNGNTWKKYTLEKEKWFFNLRMFDENYGIGLVGPHKPPLVEPHLTEDGGKTWKKMNYPKFIETTYIDDYQILNKNLFYAIIRPDGKQPYILKVKGNWEEWSMDSAQKGGIHMYFLNEEEGWISGGRKLDINGTVSQLKYHTSNGGKNWELQRDTNFNAYSVRNIKFVDKNHGMACGAYAGMLITSNGGRKWTVDYLEDLEPNGIDDFPLTDLQYTTRNHALVNASNWFIYKYTRNTSLPENHEPAIPDKPQGSSVDSFNISYTYKTKTTDPDGDSVKYYFDWGDGKLSEWSELKASGEEITASHSWQKNGDYRIRVKARDKDEMESEWSDILTITVVGAPPENRAPDKPEKPEGCLIDSIYKFYDYQIVSKDPDGDSISYYIDWGDTSKSDWSNFYASEVKVVFSHKWEKPGNFRISVRAKDQKEQFSPWSDTLEIEVIGKIISVEESNTQEFSIQPNPAGDYLEISYPSESSKLSEGLDIRIFDVFGQEMADVQHLPDVGHLSMRVDVSSLSPGLYFIRVGEKFGKFVKH